MFFSGLQTIELIIFISHFTTWFIHMTKNKLNNTASIVAFISTATAVLFSTHATATDGVIEINHTCATQLGCFSGDSVGYPVQIDGSAGKSYRLTSDLIISDENTTGISARSNYLSIDLNGFSIIRSGCENITTDCVVPVGNGHGVSSGVVGLSGLTVKNGSIVGMGRRGISHLGSQGFFDNLTIRWNQNDGISAGENSVVSNSTVNNNGGGGIIMKAGSIAKNNTSAFNTGIGISTNSSSIVVNNTVSDNIDQGMNVSGGSLVKDNVVSSNGGVGITCRASHLIANSIYNNTGNGIDALIACTISQNMVFSNDGYGIDFDTYFRKHVLTENVLRDNDLGIFEGTNYFELGDNFCQSDNVCP